MLLKLFVILISYCLFVQSKSVCQYDGYFPNSDCTGYYQCVYTGTASAQQYYYACPSGLLFDVTLNVCNWASQVNCNNIGPVASTPKGTTTSITSSISSGNLITLNEFNSALTNNGYPQPYLSQYKNLISQAGPQGGIYSKQQLAMFLAQIMWESDGLRATREYYCYPTFNAGCEYNSGGGFPGQNYFGRGYIQLSWDYNYKAASQSLYGTDILLRNPDLVASDDKVSWATAFWFWKVNVIGSQYGSKVLNGQFGASTNAINGALECRGAYTDKARKRFEIYKKVLTSFQIYTLPNESGCYN